MMTNRAHSRQALIRKRIKKQTSHHTTSLQLLLRTYGSLNQVKIPIEDMEFK
jgi:hypothetical protein